MKMIPNPEYESATLEGVALDADGKQLSQFLSAIAFGRIAPPRFKKLPSGELEEVPSHIPSTDK